MAIYYLSPTGNDTTGTGSISAPWFTLEKAWDNIVAGDTVYMRGGTYSYLKTQWLTGVTGTSGNIISLLNYPGETPIIQPATGWVYDGWYYGILFQSMNYIHVKGLEVRNFKYQQTSPCRAIMAQHINNSIFENLSCHDSEMGMMLTGNSGDNLILNCDFYNNYDPYSPIAYGNADGLDVSSIPNAYNNTVRGCRAWSNSDDGFDFWASEGIVYIENCWSWSNGYREDGTTTGGDGNGFKLGQVTETTATTRRYLYNCIGAINRVNNFSHNIVDPQVLTCELYNCFSYGAVGYAGYQFNWGAQAATNSILRNNISYNDVNGALLDTWITNDHNSWNSGYTVTSADFVSTDASQLSRPRLSNGSLPSITFGHLVSGSDLVNTGTDIGLPYVGSNPDLGPFELSTTYYIANDGDDLNIGSIDYPWSTIEKVATSTFLPGDIIYFKRGDTFRGYLLFPSNGSIGNHIIIDAYGIGAKPKLLGSKDLSSELDWVLHSGNVWKTATPIGIYSHYLTTVDVGSLFFNNDTKAGYRVWQIADVNASDRFFYNVADSLIYLYSTTNPGSAYTSIDCGGVYHENTIKFPAYRHHVTIRNIDARHSGNNCIYVDRANDIVIEYCDVSWLGGWLYNAATKIRQGNGIGAWMVNNYTYNIIIRNNKVWQAYDAGISPQGSSNTASNILMYNNIVYDCYYSYEWWCTTGQTNANINFYNNTCYNAGNNWSYDQRVDKNNSAHVMIWSLTGTVSNCGVYNNIFKTCADHGLRIDDNISKILLDYNVYDMAIMGEMNESDTYITFTEWKAASLQDDHSINADPLFISSSDFHLQSSSPAINNGVNSLLTIDYEGNIRPFNILYDIGAFEYSSEIINNDISILTINKFAIA